MIINLEEVANSADFFGNKARNLSILINKGVKIPKGIAVGVQHYLDYIYSGNFSENFKLKVNDFLEKIPGSYAIRSSANVEDSSKRSYAGQFITKLGIPLSKVFDSIREVYLSANLPSTAYSEDQIKMGVIIQQMIKADFSGVLFSYDIIDQNPNSAIIELAKGRCEKVVSGKTNPSLYIINKISNEITLFEEGDQDIRLDLQQIKYILENAKKIEDAFQSPQDIEFLFHKNEFYCLQSRNITTIEK